MGSLSYEQPKKEVTQPDVKSQPPKWSDFFNDDPRGPSTSEVEAYEKAMDAHYRPQPKNIVDGLPEQKDDSEGLPFGPHIEDVNLDNVEFIPSGQQVNQVPTQQGFVWLYSENGVEGGVPFWAKSKDEVINHVDNLVLEAQTNHKDMIVFLGRYVALEHALTIKDGICTVDEWYGNFQKPLFG